MVTEKSEQAVRQPIQSRQLPQVEDIVKSPGSPVS